MARGSVGREEGGFIRGRVEKKVQGVVVIKY